MENIIDLTLEVLKTFGFTEYQVSLSTRPEKYVGKIENWDRAEKALAEALEKKGLKHDIDAGGGAFYGPKIDLKIKDCLGRYWQCSTVQVDFNLPERFDVTYRDESGKEERAIMVHRALLGSHRTLCRHPDRAVRRRFPAVAGARPGQDPDDHGPPERFRRKSSPRT